jgi:uncharacterized protein (DUF2237 family)
MSTAKNVLGTALKDCSMDPLTGFYRTGCCDTGVEDMGLHLVCIRATPEFLRFTVAAGNDLVTPNPYYRFPGLKPGDQWCLCAQRWQEAFEAGAAPPVVLEATHMSALEFIDLDNLKEYAIDQPAGA